MAETLVLAELQVDASGIVRGIKDATGAIVGFDATLTRSGQHAREAEGLFGKVEERMVSLRHAAIALVGGFTLAGAIEEVKAFGTELIKADDGFTHLTASAHAAHESFVVFASDVLHVHEGVGLMAKEFTKASVI